MLRRGNYDLRRIRELYLCTICLFVMTDSPGKHRHHSWLMSSTAVKRLLASAPPLRHRLLTYVASVALTTNAGDREKGSSGCLGLAKGFDPPADGTDKSFLRAGEDWLPSSMESDWFAGFPHGPASLSLLFRFRTLSFPHRRLLFWPEKTSVV